jgi:hypothetical protein
LGEFVSVFGKAGEVNAIILGQVRQHRVRTNFVALVRRKGQAAAQKKDFGPIAHQAGTGSTG